MKLADPRSETFFRTLPVVPRVIIPFSVCWFDRKFEEDSEEPYPWPTCGSGQRLPERFMLAVVRNDTINPSPDSCDLAYIVTCLSRQQLTCQSRDTIPVDAT